MSIQRCPNEILDMVFQLLPFQSPDNAPTVVLSTMLTCSRFCAIAKPYLLRVVCLQTAEHVNLFAMYLTQLINTGGYDEARHPIEHMAVLRNYESTQGRPWRIKCEAEKEAAVILPFIISTVAPGLHSLVIFGYHSQFLPKWVNGLDMRNIVKSSVRFQNLTRLILLEQSIVMPCRKESSLHFCYPRLTCLYTHTGDVNHDVLASRTLRDLRLHMLDGSWALHFPPTSEPRIETITIDVPTYKGILVGSYVTLEQYQMRIEDYRTFAKSNSKSQESRVVITNPSRAGVGSILRAWRDIVQGGSGCWNKEWRPAAW